MVFTKFYENPPVDRKEVLRYAGCRDEEAVFGKLLDECIAEAEEGLSLKVCYSVFDVKIRAELCDFGAFSVKSKDLAENLKDCKRAVVFAATAGVGIDRLIAKYGSLAPSKAVMLQALGAERIEALCDAFCGDIKKEMNCETKPRFSPGYGDLDLSSQKDIFSVLNCEKHIGLTLNDSMLMSPSKSVTAIMGIIG
ncbi:MAG: Vitamin B12 dependent methionine synthase activation subunit [Clostridia bacterium]|nr:Vitamin B12 dependent methionine synthase activation subunit [Clostridia bacterium]